MTVITKCYYIENSDSLDEVVAIINTPKYTLGCSVELIEMDYIALTVECLEKQIRLVENLLAPFV